MGAVYDHHHHQHHHHTHKNNYVIPMLVCLRPTTQEDRISRWATHKCIKDPVSPKMGCMGQVKHTNKIVSLPTQHQNIKSNKSNKNIPKNTFKLTRIFSGKRFNRSFSTSSTDGRRELIASVINIDPPLPVIKRGGSQCPNLAAAGTLWKRRCGGEDLKGLKLKELRSKCLRSS